MGGGGGVARGVVGDGGAKQQIFNTDYFRATYEAKARADLERSIKALGG